jgi:hypothetical protein
LTRQPPPFHTTPMSRQELSDFQKGQIDGAARFGHSATDFHKLFGYAQSTIHCVITHIKISGSAENKEHDGCPRKSTDRNERLLLRRGLDDTKMPLRELKFEANSDLLIFLIRRRLNEEGVKKWLVVTRVGSDERLPVAIPAELNMVALYQCTRYHRYTRCTSSCLQS